MANITHHSSASRHWMRYTGLALALLWGSWWTFFGLASGISEGSGPAGVLIHTAIPGLLFLAGVLLAWRQEVIGGAVLALEGVLALGYPFARTPAGFLTLVLPPLAASGLLLLHAWKLRAAQAHL